MSTELTMSTEKETQADKAFRLRVIKIGLLAVLLGALGYTVAAIFITNTYPDTPGNVFEQIELLCGSIPQARNLLHSLTYGGLALGTALGIFTTRSADRS